MAGTQEVQMRKVEELPELIAAQSLKLTIQPDAIDAQSAQVTELTAKLAGLQRASEDAFTREPRSSSPAPDVGQGAYSVSVSRQNVPPKFHRESPQ